MALTKVRGSGIDADGQEIILDADGDTTITADTDDQIDIKIAGTDVGTFTQDSGKFTINSTGSNLSFAVGGTVELNTDSTQFYPGTDNSHNLGISSLRWNNLYLSGGVFIGGTGPGNKLEDYEEGTRSSSSVNGITASTNTVTGHYTKVGRQIVEHIKVVISGKSGGSGNPWISLSFTPSATVGTSVKQGGSIGMNTVITSSTFLNTGYMGTYGGNPSVYANDYQQSYYASGSWGNGTLVFTVIYEAD